MKVPITLIFAISTSAMLAEDLVTKDGTRYRDVKVTRVEDNGIRISHQHGMAKILFEELPPALRTKYGYDPKKAAAFTAVEQAARKAEAEKAAQNAAAAQKQAEMAAAAAAERAAAARANTPPPAPKPAPPKQAAWMDKHINGRSALDGHQFFTGGTFNKKQQPTTALTPPGSTLPPRTRPANPGYLPPDRPQWEPQPAAPPRPLTAEERKEAATQKLIIFFGLRLFAHNAQPDSADGAFIRDAVKLVSSLQISSALQEIFPQLSPAELAAAEGFVLWLTEIDPNESKEVAAKRLAIAVSKELLVEAIREKSPGLATNVEFIDGLFSLLRRGSNSAAPANQGAEK